jgi:dTDP-4-amino-4,6-dideoxygalactose transaminase
MDNMKKKIKLFDPYVTAKEEKYLLAALRSHNWASGAGSNFVNLFEKKFQEYLGAKACVSVNSGTAALHIALSAAGISQKEVIIPSLSFVSTAHAVLYNNGKVRFADRNPLHGSKFHEKTDHGTHQSNHASSFWRHACGLGQTEKACG